mmetsp:Transcript_23245/g.47527  ORF Transcript_23245/g.47527 Transcript_23245/m.47527 type:complete len:208 (+) Transcript_23245:454-1077(+)
MFSRLQNWAVTSGPNFTTPGPLGLLCTPRAISLSLSEGSLHRHWFTKGGAVASSASGLGTRSAKSFRVQLPSPTPPCRTSTEPPVGAEPINAAKGNHSNTAWESSKKGEGCAGGYAAALWSAPAAVEAEVASSEAERVSEVSFRCRGGGGRGRDSENEEEEEKEEKDGFRVVPLVAPSSPGTGAGNLAAHLAANPVTPCSSLIHLNS